MDILKKDMSDEDLKKVKLVEIKPHVKINFGRLSVFPISVTHSIPDSLLYVLYTKDGAIVYTGDFVFDSTVPEKYKTDIGKLAYVGKQGVLCLLSESIYAEREGHTSPNNRAASFIRDVLSKSEDRIIATVFPAHFYRIQELLNEVSKTHRKVVIMGKRLQETINYARENGYINFDKRIVGDLTNLNDKNTVVLISDAKESPFANLQRIIKGFDKYIKIKETDTVFITEPTYDGIEKVTAEIMDEVAMLGADAINLSSKKHLLHHASREDLMLMINLMNPKYYFPVKGEYRYQLANAKVAEEIGVPKENIILKQNGDVCEFIDGKLNLKCFDKVKVDEILVDGNNGEDVGNLVLKDREMLGENGIVIVSCTLDRATKKIVGGPEILTRGFIYVKDNQELLEQTRELCVLIINDNILENTKRVDYSKIKNEVRERLGHFFYEKTESKPMIITVIQEV
ncbi:metallo-beta-lactamase superfamily protein [human gut metagenome]|uniref:Metallo-beta-lactamase superfamily protein n=1 Tax=human gut metagenome TaxID=408170 RepID=K1SGK6_9ZZZZ